MSGSESLRWALDPGVTYLNHGCFGARPEAVVAAQAEWRARVERQPVAFILRDLPPLLDAARERLAAFVGADPAGLVFVRNATAGINGVLASLALEPGDEVLTTDHAYGACDKALRHFAERAGARVLVARVPFAGLTPPQVVEAVLGAVTPRTRLALVDHVTSPTGLVFPAAELVAGLEARGVPTLVDGAHAPGMLPLDLNALGATYYVANCHKWLCAPLGVGFLWCRADARARLHPAQISHGWRWPVVADRFHAEFDWVGTDDPSPLLTLPTALDALGGALPDGWPALMRRNRELALYARGRLAAALETWGAPRGWSPGALPAEEMVGALAAVPLPDGRLEPPRSLLAMDRLQDPLLFEDAIEVPIPAWPVAPHRVIRISAQLYNTRADYDRLAERLVVRLTEEAEMRATRC